MARSYLFLPALTAAAITAEKDFEGDGRTIRYAATAAPGIVNSFVLPRRSKDVYGRLTAGARLSLGEAAALTVQGSSSFSQTGSDDVAGFQGGEMCSQSPETFG